MTDHDFVLTAARQANPRPAGAAGRQGEWSTSELLFQVEKRSGTMETIERRTETKPSPSPGPGRRRGLLAASAALVVVIVAAAVVLALTSREDEPDVATADGSTVAAEDSRFEATFASDAVVVAGPDLVTEGLVEITVRNETDREASIVGMRFSDESVLADELATLGLGENQARSGQESGLGLVAFTVDVPPGIERTESVSLTSGWYLLDWITADEFGIPDHTWRVKEVQVVENAVPVTSFDGVTGTYLRKGPGAPTYFLIFEDGTIHASPDTDLIGDSPVTIHQSSFEGTSVIISTSDSMCNQPDLGATYEIRSSESGSLVFVAVGEDPCELRSAQLQGFGNNDVEFVSLPGSPIRSFADIAGTVYTNRTSITPSYFYFFEDGAWHVGSKPDLVEQFPAGIVEARFDGPDVVLTNIQGACSGPAEARYQIHRLENGSLRLILVDDPCGIRSGFFPGEWAPVPQV